MGLYAEQARRWMTSFSKNQIMVLLHDQLQERPVETCQRIFAFVGVELESSPDVAVRHSVPGLPGSQRASRLLNRRGPLRPVGLAEPVFASRERLQNRQKRLLQRNLGRRVSPAPLLDELQKRMRGDTVEVSRVFVRDVGGWLERAD